MLPVNLLGQLAAGRPGGAGSPGQCFGNRCHGRQSLRSFRTPTPPNSAERIIRFAANRFPSHSGEAAIRSRSPARSAASRGRSPARDTASSTYSSRFAGDGFRQPDVGQMAQAVPAGERLAGAGDHRHAHPQCFAGGSAAAERERVQARGPPAWYAASIFRVDSTGRRASSAPGRSTLARQTRSSKRRAHRGSSPSPLIFQHQPRLGQAAENPRPDLDHLRRDLGQVVEAAEGHLPAASAGNGPTGGASAGGS